MITPNPEAAKAIEANAANIAATACNQFIKTQPQLASQASVDIYDSWAHHFQQRVMELSAAVAAGEPALFTARVEWSRQAMAARFLQNINLRDTLQSLREVLTETLPPDSLAEALHCLDQAINDYSEEPAKPEVSQLDPGHALERLALFYLQAALEGNVNEAMQIVLDAVDDGLDARQAITGVLLAAQREVGHLWHLDQITIAEEHLVTTTTQRLMAILASKVKRAPDRGKTAVAAAVSGNVHDIGIRAISYLMEMDGWRMIFLGPDVPRNNLPAAVHFYDADLVMLSLTLSSQLSSMCDTVAAIRSHCENNVKILVGGNAFRDAPETWKSTGADAYAESAEQVLQVAEQLVAPKTRH